MSGDQPGADEADDAREERLLVLLGDLERDEGRMKTAEALGVSYRTLVRAIESGSLSARMRDALERRVLAEGGEDAVRQRAHTEALEQRIEGLEERLAAQEAANETRADTVAELDRRLAESRGAVETLDSRVARLEDRRLHAPHGVPAGTTTGEQTPVGSRGVVTREPHEGEGASYGAGAALVEEWRTLNRGRGDGTGLDQAKVRERIMELEITMIGEHALTLPPNSEPLHPSERERYLGWRRRELADIRGTRRQLAAWRWVRRVLTLGLWWR